MLSLQFQPNIKSNEKEKRPFIKIGFAEKNDQRFENIRCRLCAGRSRQHQCMPAFAQELRAFLGYRLPVPPFGLCALPYLANRL